LELAVLGVVDPASEREQHTALGEGVADVSGIGNRSCESIQLRDNECVARSYRGEGLIQPRSLAFGAAHAVVDVDAIRGNAERE
jgi:hypothetical protein